MEATIAGQPTIAINTSATRTSCMIYGSSDEYRYTNQWANARDRTHTRGQWGLTPRPPGSFSFRTLGMPGLVLGMTKLLKVANIALRAARHAHLPSVMD